MGAALPASWWSSLSPAVDRVCFRVAGGRSAQGVVLEVEGVPVLSARGQGDDRLRDQCWDITPYHGRPAGVVLLDRSGSEHIVFDDLECTSAGRLIPCS